MVSKYGGRRETGQAPSMMLGRSAGEFMVLLANGLKVWGKKRDRAGSINDVR